MQELPLAHVSRLPEQSGENGLDVTFRTYPVGHRMSQEEFADISAWLDSWR